MRGPTNGNIGGGSHCGSFGPVHCLGTGDATKTIVSTNYAHDGVTKFLIHDAHTSMIDALEQFGFLGFPSHKNPSIYKNKMMRSPP